MGISSWKREGEESADTRRGTAAVGFMTIPWVDRSIPGQAASCETPNAALLLQGTPRMSQTRCFGPERRRPAGSFARACRCEIPDFKFQTKM